MQSLPIQRYEEEIKNKGLLKYLKAKNEHFKNQSTAFYYTIGSLWPVFGFSSIAHRKPEGLLEVAGSFMLGILPSALLGMFLFSLVNYAGKEILFRFFKKYRESYNNLAVEQQNFVDIFKDLKNQKIILEFIEWKRKYHMAPVVFHDIRTKSNIDVENVLVCALANKNYDYAADIFMQYNNRIDTDNSAVVIEKYRKKLDEITLETEPSNESLEMEMGDDISQKFKRLL